MEKLARIYDDEILPVWSQRFGRMLLRDLAVPERGQVLDVACGTGYPAVELLRRVGEETRLIAIDPSSSMLDVARKKIQQMGRKGVFFRTESPLPRLSFAEDVYDLVICNLGLAEMPDPQAAVADFARVTLPGGQVRCALPLRNTFQEFYDIYTEVLIKHDKHDALDRLNAHLETYPSVEECEQWAAAAGLVDVKVDFEEFSMLFKSSREFFFAPVIEFGSLSEWKAIAGAGQEMQDVFWYIKEAIDAYFGGRAFEVTVRAGCMVGTVPLPAQAAAQAGRSEDSQDAIEINTDEIELQEVSAVSDFDDLSTDVLASSDPFIHDDIEIDAFVEGRERPDHLDLPDDASQD